jgi:predicted transcriptional regulator
MTGIRIHDDTKERLDWLAGRDLSHDDVIQILLKRFITDEEEDDEAQRSIEDYLADDDE